LLLSNKKLLAEFFFILLALISGCDKSPQSNASPLEDYLGDNQKLLAHLKKNFDPNTEAALFGRFFSDQDGEILAIKETKPSKTDKWGLKIQLLSKDSLTKKDEAFLPEMSTTESICSVQRIESFPNDFFYYNSGGFYTGSSGGEVYAYLVDFATKQNYYAHLVIVPEKPATLFISKNCEANKTKDFFLNLFKTDYPELVISRRDISSD